MRLLGPYDLMLQARDRALPAPSAAQAKQPWPALGPPGAVLAGDRLAGSWRARKGGRAMALSVAPWGRAAKGLKAGIEEQAARLAAFRGLEPGPIEYT